MGWKKKKKKSYRNRGKRGSERHEGLPVASRGRGAVALPNTEEVTQMKVYLYVASTDRGAMTLSDTDEVTQSSCCQQANNQAHRESTKNPLRCTSQHRVGLQRLLHQSQRATHGESGEYHALDHNHKRRRHILSSKKPENIPGRLHKRRAENLVFARKNN